MGKLRMLSVLSVSGAVATSWPGCGASSAQGPTSPQRKRNLRDGWKSTLLRRETFQQLRSLQKSTVDPRLDLSYLTDACVRLALDLGAEHIVRRAIADLKPVLRKS